MIAQFRQHLVAMIDFYEELEPVDPDHLVQGELRSEVMFKEDKKYHVDLKVTSIRCSSKCLLNQVNSIPGRIAFKRIFLFSRKMLVVDF